MEPDEIARLGALNHGWVLELDPQDAATLADLRLRPDVEVALCQEPPRLWVRGQKSDDFTRRILSLLPAMGRYDWLMPDRLRKLRSRIPAVRLPTLEWKPLCEYLSPEFPEINAPGQATEATGIQLVRGGNEKDATLIVTTLDTWVEYVLNAPRIRIEHLTYAVSERSDVVVAGSPLPSIQGQRFAEYGGIAIPCGWQWDPFVAVDVLEKTLARPPGGRILWFHDNFISRLHPEQFVEATRSSVRRTVENQSRNITSTASPSMNGTRPSDRQP